MPLMVDRFADSEEAARRRNAMTDQLKKDGFITTPAVQRAFRTVLRHAFTPEGTSLEAAYADDAVTTKTNEGGLPVSSISAPFLQATMIEQAGLGRGESVLEVGSGGYNAALVAEVVGSAGRVVSVDIDADVTDWAGTVLEATGYSSRVSVVRADAEYPVPGLGSVDVVLVTVGAWDIPPAWISQLAPGGRLVVPLRMGGVTRSIAFHRVADHLESMSAEVCGFVLMQGEGAHNEPVLRLPDPQGGTVGLRFDVALPERPELLDGVLATEPDEVWSGVTIGHRVSFADLHLWCAGFLPGYCRVSAEDGTRLAGEQVGRGWFPYGVVRGGSFAYLAVRPALGGAGVEFGARRYGQGEAAAALVEQVQAWDAAGRRTPYFAYWPDGSDRPHSAADTADGSRVAVLKKNHGLVTISWPASS